MFNTLIQKARDLWKTDLTENEAKHLLEKYPNIMESYYIQKSLFGHNIDTSIRGLNKYINETEPFKHLKK